MVVGAIDDAIRWCEGKKEDSSIEDQKVYDTIIGYLKEAKVKSKEEEHAV